MMTKVDSGGLFRTLRSSSVARLISAAFSAAVTEFVPGAVPSRVVWMVTIGMVVSPLCVCKRSCSVAGALAAIDMQDFAGHERRVFEKQHRIDDVADLAHPADRM